MPAESLVNAKSRPFLAMPGAANMPMRKAANYFRESGHLSLCKPVHYASRPETVIEI